MTFGDYAVGAAFFVATYGSLAFAAAAWTRRVRRDADGVLRILAFAAIFTALLVAAHLIPAMFGILDRWSAAITAAVLAVGTAVALRRSPPVPPSEDQRTGADPGGRAGRLVAGLGLLVVTAFVLADLSARHAATPDAVDMMSFHMPDVARWLQTGSIWQAPELAPEWAQGNYPHNGEMVLLSIVLPWRNDAFVRFIYYPYFALLGLGTFALARQLRAPRSAAALAAALTLALPVVAANTFLFTKPDVVLWATFVVGLVFLVRHWRSGARSDLVLAALGLGLAFGSKWYGVSSVIVVLGMWAISWLIARRPWRALLRYGTALAGGVVLAGGFWLLRNLVVSDNPLFAIKVSLLGHTVFDAPRDLLRERLGFSIVHYATDVDALRYAIWPALRGAVSAPGAVLAAGVLGTAVVVLASRRRERRPTGTGLAAVGVLAVLGLALSYAATPFSAFGPEGHPSIQLTHVSARYGVTALVCAAPLVAWATGQLRGRAYLAIEVATLVAIVYGIDRALRPGAADLAKAVVALAALAVLGAAAVAWRKRAATRAHRGRYAAGVAVAGAVLTLVAGQAHQAQYNRERFLHEDAAVAWVQEHAPSGHRIGVAGPSAMTHVVPIYPMFGPRLRNHVSWVGPLVQGMLRSYHTAAPFVARVRRERYDFVMIERGTPPRPSVPEEGWVRQAGYKPLVRSADLTLYERIGVGS